MPEKSRQNFLILTVTTIASFMTAFMGSSMNIALPVIGNEMNIGAVLLSWLATAYLMTTAVMLLPAGKLSDIYGRGKFFKAGVLIFAFGTLLCAMADSWIIFLIFRLVQGAGSAMMFSTSMAILVSAYPGSERGKVIGINITAVYSGLSSGPIIGGLITYNFGWRYIFYLSFVIGISVFLLSIYFLRTEWKDAKGEIFDSKGSFVYITAMISLMLGMTLIPDIYGIILSVFGFIMIFYFYKMESELSSPLFDVRIFRSNRTFIFSNIAALINYSATFAIGFIMSLYLQNIRGMTSQEAGIVLMTQPVVMALFSPIAGRISDKVEPQAVASAGMGLLTVCLIFFIFLTPGFSIALITINLAVIGFGFALFSSPNSNAVMGSVEKKYYGVASSSLSSMRMIGQMFSMGIVILIISMFLGKAEISAENTEMFIISIRIIFLIFSVLCFLGIFASLSRGKIHNQKM